MTNYWVYIPHNCRGKVIVILDWLRLTTYSYTSDTHMYISYDYSMCTYNIPVLKDHHWAKFTPVFKHMWYLNKSSMCTCKWNIWMNNSSFLEHGGLLIKKNLNTMFNLHVQTIWGGSRGGGGPGVQGPPLVPREGVLDPSSKMKKTAFQKYILKFWLIYRLILVRNKNIYIYCVNYIKLHQESMKVCFCWRKNERIQ